MNENRVEEVKSLVKKLNKYRDEYYNNNNSIISDREYDELFDKLIVLERETGCIFSNSPTQSVGYMSLSQLQKVKHSHPLLSLGNLKRNPNIVSTCIKNKCICIVTQLIRFMANFRKKLFGIILRMVGSLLLYHLFKVSMKIL